MTKGLELAPNHFVDNANVRLDDANHLSAYILIHIVRHRNTRKAVADQGDGDIHALKQAESIDAREHEAAFIKGFGALGGGADADGREGMPHRSKERALLGQRT